MIRQLQLQFLNCRELIQSRVMRLITQIKCFSTTEEVIFDATEP